MDRFSRDTHASAGNAAPAFHSYSHKKKYSNTTNANGTPNHTYAAPSPGSFGTNAHGYHASPPAGSYNNNTNSGYSQQDGGASLLPPPPGYSNSQGSQNSSGSAYPLLSPAGSVNATANAATAHGNAATSYSAVAAGEHTKDECTSTAFRNYNNYVKKAIIQYAIDAVATKMAASDAATTRRAEEELANPSNQQPSLNGSFSLPPANHNATANAPPPPPYGTRSPGGSSNRQFYFGPNGKGITVLDLASGRGGDIGKWIYGQCPPFAKMIGHHANDPSKFISVKKYLAVDIAPGAVQAAQQRYVESKSQDNERIMKVRHHTPLADGYFFVANCLVGSFFDAPPRHSANVFLGNGVPSNAMTPNLGPYQRPPGESPNLRPRSGACSVGGALPPPPPPSYNEAVSAHGGGGIMNRSNPATPQSLLRTSPGLGPRAPSATADRFGGSPSLNGAAPPPFVQLPPSQQGTDSPPPAISYLADALRSTYVDEINIVSVQFAFHYACFSPDNLRAVLKGIVTAMRGANTGGGAGGILLLTTVDGKELSKRLIDTYNNQLAGKSTVEYVSDLYTLTAETAAVGGFVHEAALAPSPAPAPACLPLGTMYRFKLDGLVDCEEFVVPFETLVGAASAEGLRLVDSKPFASWMQEFSTNKKVKQQLGPDGEVSAADVDLISIYRTYVFEV